MLVEVTGSIASRLQYCLVSDCKWIINNKNQMHVPSYSGIVLIVEKYSSKRSCSNWTKKNGDIGIKNRYDRNRYENHRKGKYGRKRRKPRGKMMI